ncbi:STAS domain-containing protein [Streptomyces shenzhenensis]|uniref:STAS domain-containing protein n=1 Tax=Streptomyces shenzhenensis TaxID=943815 RepID=UPI001F21CE15|nr:STAS domain-containing protein [Streptomyces shenzhenensis]
MPVFDVRISDSPTRIVLALSGELDYPARVRAAAVTGPLALGGRDLTVDLTRVGFMDAGGLGMLLCLRRRVVAGGGVMELRGTRPQVWRVLELTGTDAQFGTVADAAGDGVALPRSGG